jgi:hypothetical protein
MILNFSSFSSPHLSLIHLLKTTRKLVIIPFLNLANQGSVSDYSLSGMISQHEHPLSMACFRFYAQLGASTPPPKLNKSEPQDPKWPSTQIRNPDRDGIHQNPQSHKPKSASPKRKIEAFGPKAAPSLPNNPF